MYRRTDEIDPAGIHLVLLDQAMSTAEVSRDIYVSRVEVYAKMKDKTNTYFMLEIPHADFTKLTEV